MIEDLKNYVASQATRLQSFSASDNVAAKSARGDGVERSAREFGREGEVWARAPEGHSEEASARRASVGTSSSRLFIQFL